METGSKEKKYTGANVCHDLLRCMAAGAAGSAIAAGIGAVIGALFYQDAATVLTPPQQGAVSVLLMAGSFIMLIGSFLLTIRVRPEKAREPGARWRKLFRCFPVPTVLLLAGTVMVIAGFAVDLLLRAML